MSRTSSRSMRGYDADESTYGKEVPSTNVVSGAGGCSPYGCRKCSKRAYSDGGYEEDGRYMDRLARHARSKLLSPDKVRKIAEERFNPEEVLEGGDERSRNCCVRKTYSGSLLGDMRRVASYVCTENYEGECKWRSCREPSTACMYLVEHRVNIKEDGNKAVGGVAVRKSILIPGCTMKEAQSEADNDFFSQK